MKKSDVKPSRTLFLPKLCIATDLKFSRHQTDLESSSLDACFIQSVTAMKMVCGSKRYKCSSCLCFYDDLEKLLAHILQGWREGYSCRVFYRKLKDMKDREPLTAFVEEEEEEEEASESKPQLGASSTLTQRARKQKLDMIRNWMEECLSCCWQ